MKPSSKHGSQITGDQLANNADQVMAYGCSPLASGIVHSYFNVQDEAPQRQLLDWRDRVGHIIDVLPSLAQLENPFSASIGRYAVGELVFTDYRYCTSQCRRVSYTATWLRCWIQVVRGRLGRSEAVNK